MGPPFVSCMVFIKRLTYVHLDTSVAGSFRPPACHLRLLTTLIGEASRGGFCLQTPGASWCSVLDGTLLPVGRASSSWGGDCPPCYRARISSGPRPLEASSVPQSLQQPDSHLGGSQHSLSSGSDKVVFRVKPTSLLVGTLLTFSQTLFPCL